MSLSPGLEPSPHPSETLHSRASPRALSRPLQLWHLLSLDAPTVAALWTWFLARVSGVRLPLSIILAMFLAVWVLYAADRLLDARPLLRNDPALELEARHRFHHRHRSRFLLALALVVLALALLLPGLDSHALRLDLVLGALLFGYFVLIHATASARRLPKELAVGIFFSAAVFIPVVARRPDLQLSLLPVAVLFAALCSLNCLAIYAWEHESAPIFSIPAAHPLTRSAVRRLPLLCLALVVASLAASFFSAHLLPLLAVALSASALLALHRRRRRLLPVTLRAAADLALLTPLLLLPALAGR